MKKLRIIPIIIVLFSITAFFTNCESDDDTDITGIKIVNAMTGNIIEIYIKTSDSEDWGENRLESSESLFELQSEIFEVDPGEYDIKTLHIPASIFTETNKTVSEGQLITLNM